MIEHVYLFSMGVLGIMVLIALFNAFITLDGFMVGFLVAVTTSGVF